MNLLSRSRCHSYKAQNTLKLQKNNFFFNKLDGRSMTIKILIGDANAYHCIIEDKKYVSLIGLDEEFLKSYAVFYNLLSRGILNWLFQCFAAPQDKY